MSGRLPVLTTYRHTDGRCCIPAEQVTAMLRALAQLDPAHKGEGTAAHVQERGCRLVDLLEQVADELDVAFIAAISGTVRP